MMLRLMTVFTGAALLAYAAGLVLTSGGFPPPGDPSATKQQVVLLVVATMAVALLHVGVCLMRHRFPLRLLHVLLVAGGARLVLLFGAPPPLLEGDPERVRFDARMLNQGINPYEFLPVHLMDGDQEERLRSGPQLDRLLKARAALSASADAPRPESVRRPDLRASSPPLAIWIGALADRFKPQSIRGYAFLILVADCLAMFLLILALRKMGLPPGWLIVYAWSPVLLKEIYVTLALDAFVLPALAGVVYGIAAGRRRLTAIPLAVAGALRWPMLMLSLVQARRIGVQGVLLVLALLCLPFLPFARDDLPTERYAEGPIHAWRHFEYNSLAENLFRGLLRHLPTRAENSLTVASVPILSPDERLDALLAKVAAGILLLGVVTYLMIRISPPPDFPGQERHPALTDLFFTLAALLLVSPVLMPSHTLWLLPLLVVRPFGLAWLVLPALASCAALTHLGGPDQADLTLPGGRISFRLFEYGAFGLLLLLDVLWKGVLFPIPEGIERRRNPGAPPAESPDEAVTLYPEEAESLTSA